MHSVLLALDNSHWIWTLLSLLSVPTLVALNGLFVAAEFSLVAVRRTRIEELRNQGVAGANAVMHAISHLDRSIAATQLGITLASIALGFVGEPTIAQLFTPLFTGLDDTWQFLSAHGLAVAVAFLLITFMHVIFGELIPKSIALQFPDRIALMIARPLLWFTALSRPFIVAINGTGNAVLRLLGYKPARGEEMIHSVEELQLLIEDTEEAGLIEPEQADLIENVFELNTVTVRESMVPREKVASLDVGSPPEQILEAVRQGAHTRMPVYDGTLDNIVGIVNTKDLFYLFSVQGVVILQDAVYPALFLPADASIGDALQLFKKAKRHMALVRDENDKIVGVITLEDVLEQIVGEIEDEHDATRTERARLIRTVKPRITKLAAARRALAAAKRPLPSPPASGGEGPGVRGG